MEDKSKCVLDDSENGGHSIARLKNHMLGYLLSMRIVASQDSIAKGRGCLMARSSKRRTRGQKSRLMDLDDAQPV